MISSQCELELSRWIPFGEKSHLQKYEKPLKNKRWVLCHSVRYTTVILCVSHHIKQIDKCMGKPMNEWASERVFTISNDENRFYFHYWNTHTHTLNIHPFHCAENTFCVAICRHCRLLAAASWVRMYERVNEWECICMNIGYISWNKKKSWASD